ncbi:MAG: RNA polymerase sigma factor [Armatimonadota bacterium]
MVEDLQVQDLVLRARSGEVAAFEQLYRSHQAGIYTFILMQVRNREIASDLTQDTFVRAWQSLRRLRKPGAFRGWLHRIAANLVRDEAKSGRARLEIPESALAGDDGWVPELARGSASDPQEEAASMETRAAVWRALGELSAEHRAAVVMHHLEGMSVKEIATAAGVRPGTIMSRLARAREALRSRLGPMVEAEDGSM